jgi:acyl carrier protein
MDTDKFIKDFVTIFDNEPANSLSMKTSFRDIEGWSSLTALAFMALADEKYNVKVKGDDIRNSKTIADLFNIVKSKM